MKPEENRQGEPGPNENRRTVEDIVSSLSAELARHVDRLAGQLDRWIVFEAMRRVASPATWDAMPIDDERVGAVRLILAHPTEADGPPTYLLVTFWGSCFIEGQLPAHPVAAAEYLDLRRRFMEVAKAPDEEASGLAGGRASCEGYEAMCDRLADAIVECLLPAADGKRKTEDQDRESSTPPLPQVRGRIH